MTTESQKTEEEKKWDAYIDHLIEVMESIQPGEVTILTGRNGGGKSMIRKLLPQFLREKEPFKTEKLHIASTSMDDRAGVDPGRMMVFSRDCEWLPTSENTLQSVEGVLQETGAYMILDEIELGMGEEVQMGLALDINSKMDEALKIGKGILIITHSRTIVRHMQHSAFINLEGMTEEEWLNREVVPISPEELKDKSDKLYRAFQKRLKKSRE